MQLQKKVIMITGATAGVGSALAAQLAEHNRLIVLGRNEEKLRTLTERYSDVDAYPCDLSDLSAVKATAAAIGRNHPKIDVLINNAAVQFTPHFLHEDFRYESIHEEVTVNFTAVCSLIYLLLPAMLSDDSRAVILNVNSGLALAPKTSSAVYCAGKGALLVFSQSLAYQLENTAVKVLQAFLPLVDTVMTHGRGSGKLSAEAAAAAMIRGIVRETPRNYVGRTKILRLVLRISPTLAAKIMKKF